MQAPTGRTFSSGSASGGLALLARSAGLGRASWVRGRSGSSVPLFPNSPGDTTRSPERGSMGSPCERRRQLASRIATKSISSLRPFLRPYNAIRLRPVPVGVRPYQSSPQAKFPGKSAGSDGSGVSQALRLPLGVTGRSPISPASEEANALPLKQKHKQYQPHTYLPPK